MQPQASPPSQPPQGFPTQQASGVSSGTSLPPPKHPNSSQNTLLVSEMREGMMIMNDGSFRAVISCESINFDLMSSREREGVEYSYQNFLNSLYFPVQILVRSQRIDIGPYLERLSKIRRSQDNMLLGMLMDDYIGFIDAVSREANIMDKQFYIVVPFFTAGDMMAIANAGKNIFASLFGSPQAQHVRIDKAAYEKAKEEMGNRVNAVQSGLFQMGVRSKQLDTKQLSQLLYNYYNPDTAVREPLFDADNMTGTYVRKGEGESPQPTTGEVV